MLKLEKYVVKSNVLSWFKSYLSDRTQLVKCDTSVSKSLPVEVCVPQGTVLGPVIFYFYQRLSHVFKKIARKHVCWLHYMLCARVYYRRSSKLLTDRCTNVHSASTWYNDNKLSLNIDKSGCTLLGTRQRLHNSSNIEIILDDKFYKCMNVLLI